VSYVDAPGLLERFDEIELLASADRDGDQVVDSSLVEQAINDAGAEIDAYLRARYTLPLPDPVDPLIGRLAADIARYLLQDDNPLDEAVERYRRAVETLRRIANGQMHLQVVTLRSTLSVATDSPGRLFTHETLAGF
jgi:phage gp36-like protein